MANRYWVGTATAWNNILSWASTSGGTPGASVPGSSDAAFLDANSGSGTVTLDISPTIQTLTCTGFTGTLAFGTNTISLNSTGTIFTGATTMTVTGTPLIICTNSSATSRVINPTAVTEANSISFRITAGTGTMNLSSAVTYRDLDFTDEINPTGYAGALANSSNTIYGNFKASSGMTRTAGTGVYTFAATSGTKTINTAGVAFDNPFTFNGVGGTWQLVSALTSGDTRTATLINGTLDLNGYTLTTGLFSSNNGNIRTLAFNTGNITLTGSSTTIWTTGNATNFSFTGTPTINCTYSGSTGTRTFQLNNTGGTETNVVNINITAGTDGVTIGSSSKVKNLNLTGWAGALNSPNTTYYGSLTKSSGMTDVSAGGTSIFAATSGTNTITSNGVAFACNVTFNGIGGTWVCADALSTGANALTMTNGTLKLAAGTTSTVDSFVTSGTNQKYLLSSTEGTQATISDASGTNTVTYLTIQDNIATGGATWNATSLTNANISNNTGWLFGVATSGVIYTRRKNKRYFY